MKPLTRIKKSAQALFSVIFLLVPVAFVFAQRTGNPPPAAVEYNEAAWKTFATPDGGFSILMPGQPVKSGQVVETELGPLPYFTFTLKTATAEYMASYSDFPFPVTEPSGLKRAYDGSREGMKKMAPFTLTAEREIQLEGRLGRELIFESEQNIIKARLLIVNRRLFQAIIMTRKYQNSSRDIIKFYESTINKFLDSLKVTDLKATDKPDAEPATALAKVDLGRVENSTYTNQQFAFKVNLPSGWHVQERATSEATMKLGREIAKGSDKRVNDALNNSAQTTTILFMVSKFPVSSPGGAQALMQCAVEKVFDPRVTSHLYMESNKKIMLGTSLQYKLTRDTHTQMIGGLNFSVFEVERPSGDVTVKQKYYGAMRKGFALFFVATYITEEDRLVLEKMMQTVKFE